MKIKIDTSLDLKSKHDILTHPDSEWLRFLSNPLAQKLVQTNEPEERRSGEDDMAFRTFSRTLEIKRRSDIEEGADGWLLFSSSFI